MAAEKKADALFEAIEAQRLVRPGQLETDVDRDIYALAAETFDVEKHWHKRIVRAVPNTQRCAEESGWLFGGAVAGHIVGPFPHARIPGDKDLYRISPANPQRLRDPDAQGHTRHWIIEVHLVDGTRSFGGFYERLLQPADA